MARLLSPSEEVDRCRMTAPSACVGIIISECWPVGRSFSIGAEPVQWCSDDLEKGGVAMRHAEVNGVGRISIEFEVVNEEDLVLERHGMLPPGKVRRMTIMGVVDSGAAR